MKPFSRVLILSGVLAFVAGCAEEVAEVKAAPPLPAETGEVMQANTKFAIDLYRKLAESEAGKNLFFSPYSMSSALVMALDGARGETASEMSAALGFGKMSDLAAVDAAFSALDRRFSGADRNVPAAVRSKIEALRAKLKTSNEAVARLQGDFNNFQKARQLGEEAQKVADELNKLLTQVDQYELRVANALWGEKTFPFRKEYLDAMKKSYDTSGLFEVDFRGQPEQARQQINAWVEKQTRDRIKNLVPQGAVDPDTRFIITNAIYFKGEWSEIFEASETKDEDFLLADGKKVQAPLMRKMGMGSVRYAAFTGDGTFFDTPRRVSLSPADGKEPPRYPDDAGFLVLEMAYKGDELSMVILAPQNPAGLAALEQKLSPESLAAWIGKLDQRETDVFVPRFKLETDYQMKPALESLGMTRAFVDPRKPNGADFTGICESTDPKDRLYISQVLHKAFVDVNEKGTEAAAATAVIFPAAAAMPTTVPFTPTFRADRPFVFLIRDKKSGSVLFLGRVLNPVGQSG